MRKGSVSINIVNWNGGDLISECLKSVFGQDYTGLVEVWVVDNGSGDGSLEKIETNYPNVSIFRNGHNLGFAKAHNQAIALSRSEFYLLLNYDIKLEKSFISKMVESISARKDLGMVSGKLYRGTGAGSKTLDSTGIEMPFYFQTPRGELQEDTGQFDSERDIFGPCGAAPLYRREMLEDIKIGDEYFDEDFVNYVEDVDLAWRAQLKGWKSVYAPGAVAYHFRGITRVNDEEIRKQYYLMGYRNRYWAIYKNISGKELSRSFYKIFLKEAIFLLTRKPGSCSRKVVIQAVVDAFKGRGRISKKRKAIQGDVRVQVSYMEKFFGYDRLNAFTLTGVIVGGGARRIMKKTLGLFWKLVHSFKRVIISFLKNVYGKLRKK